MYQDFIDKIGILSSLDKSEKMKICDCLEAKMFKEGESVVTQGEVGSNFFMIQFGTAEAVKTNPSTQKGKKEKEITERGKCDAILRWRLLWRIGFIG